MSLYEQYKNHIDKQSEDYNPEEEFTPMLTKIKWDTIEDVYRGIVRKKIKLDMQDGIFNSNFKISNKIMQEMDKSNRERTKAKKEQTKPCWLITINPRDDVDFNELWNEVVSFTKTVWFSEGYITWEQRGESIEEMGKGMHIHILVVKYNIEFGKFQTNLNRKFGKFINPQKLKETLNIQNKPRDELECVIDEYIMANGKQDEKITKVEIDKLWREKMGLKAYYHFECEIGSKAGLTTDKKPAFKKADGRRANGGKRNGAGPPKGNCNRWKNKIPDLPSTNDVEFEYKKKIIEF